MTCRDQLALPDRGLLPFPSKKVNGCVRIKRNQVLFTCSVNFLMGEVSAFKNASARSCGLLNLLLCCKLVTAGVFLLHKSYRDAKMVYVPWNTGNKVQNGSISN